MHKLLTCRYVHLFQFAMYQADKVLAARGQSKPGDTTEKAAEILMASFRVCVSDLRAAKHMSKKWGTLPVINQLFKVYFRVRNLLMGVEEVPYVRVCSST